MKYKTQMMKNAMCLDPKNTASATQNWWDPNFTKHLRISVNEHQMLPDKQEVSLHCGHALILLLLPQSVFMVYSLEKPVSMWTAKKITGRGSKWKASIWQSIASW